MPESYPPGPLDLYVNVRERSAAVFWFGPVDRRNPRSILEQKESPTMKYMLLTYLDEKVWLALSAEEQKKVMDECGPHVEKTMAKKKILAGAPLHPTSTATTLRNDPNGKRLMTDGPFAETREQLGGYTIIEADDLDDAIAIASGFLGTSTLATIEVRPIVDLGGPVPTV